MSGGTFVLTHFDGSMDESTSLDEVDDLVAELDAADVEHPDVAISDESGWTLSAYRSGKVLWENVERGDDEYSLDGVSRDEVIRLFRLVAVGDLDAIHRMPWQRRE